MAHGSKTLMWYTTAAYFVSLIYASTSLGSKYVWACSSEASVQASWVRVMFAFTTCCVVLGCIMYMADVWAQLPVTRRVRGPWQYVIVAILCSLLVLLAHSLAATLYVSCRLAISCPPPAARRYTCAHTCALAALFTMLHARRPPSSAALWMACYTRCSRACMWS